MTVRLPTHSIVLSSQSLTTTAISVSRYTESLYNDTVCEAELMYEAEKYYANILNLYSPMVTKKIQQILGMNLPLAMICPSHGVIWKNNPTQIVEKYLAWANAYQENQVTLIYDTM